MHGFTNFCRDVLFIYTVVFLSRDIIISPQVLRYYLKSKNDYGFIYIYVCTSLSLFYKLIYFSQGIKDLSGFKKNCYDNEETCLDGQTMSSGFAGKVPLNATKSYTNHL